MQNRLMQIPDTGERRRWTDVARPVTELIDAGTVLTIAEEAWLALVGEDEVLVPLPGEPPADPLSSWVEVVGPWTGAVVLTCGRATAGDLTRAMLRECVPEVLDVEDVEDALGELANVVGGNVKAVLPGPSVLGLPEVGGAPPAGSPADTCRVDVLWRGQPLTISVQGPARAVLLPAGAVSLPAGAVSLPAGAVPLHGRHENEVPL